MNINFFKKYPSGFSALFWVKALYTFSFQGIKSVFILYVISHLFLPEKVAISLYATFMVLCYATSLLGGYIADRGFGVRNAILVGGVVNILGMTCFIFPSQDLCFVGLSLFSLGSGLAKPNLSAFVGILFKDPQDLRKDDAFSLYYMATNLGGFFAPIFCGFIGQRYGWTHGLGILIAAFSLGMFFLFKDIHLKYQEKSVSFLKKDVSMIVLLGGIFVLVAYLLFKYRDSFHSLMGFVSVGSLLYLFKILYQCNSQEKKNVLEIILYVFLFTIFCSLFEQVGSSLMLFFEKHVNRQIMGIKFPSSVLLSLSPIFVLLFSPLLLFFKEKYLKDNKPTEGLAKASTGFLFVSFSFGLLAFSAYYSEGLVSPFWIIGAIFIQTMGELFIIPVGLSNISKLSPLRFRSAMMSFWLMAIAYGHYFAGLIAPLSIRDFHSPTVNSLTHYSDFFSNLSLLPLGVSLFLFILHGLKREGRKEKRSREPEERI